MPPVPALTEYRLEVSSAVIIEERSSEDVWSFMRRPENAALVQDEIKKAYSVPGTGPGIGEMLVYETERDGAPLAYVLTVTEETVGESFSVDGEIRRSDGRKMPLGQTWTVNAVVDGARATTTAWFDLPVAPDGQAWRDALHALQVEVDGSMRRLKLVLETEGLDSSRAD